VFHVTHKDSPDEDWNRLEAYDPGRDVADWVGVSLYGAQEPDATIWLVFSKRMDKVYKRLSALPGNRPIIVCEFGFTSGTKEGNPVTWAEDALDSLLAADRWPRIRRFSWWNEAWTDEDHGRSEMRLHKIPGLPTVFEQRLAHNPGVVDRPIYA